MSDQKAESKPVQSNEKTIRVMIVDDHAVVRGGLSKFLLVYKDLELVAEAENGEVAVQLCGLHRPDVVLMDMVMPGMDGVTATRQIKQRYPHVQVIALTSFPEENLVQGALQAGAMGYLLKNVTATELAAAIRLAHAGRMTLSSEASEALANSLRQPPTQDNQLTEREREVLSLMVKGMSNQEIANKLVVSLGTVKFHIGNIFMKLGVQSRVEAVTLALQRHMVD
jgi:two-component system, NarL family, response regulator LiaR